MFSTYAGGSGSDNGVGIALDALNNIYVVGDTTSADFPVTPNAFQTIPEGSSDVFVLKVSSVAPTAQSQTITFPNPGQQTYGVAPITLAATASSGLSVSYLVTSTPAGIATVSGSTLTITGTGTMTVQAIQAGNSSYAPASASVSFSISPAALSVTANSTSIAFAAPIPALTGTVTGVATGDGITASYSTTATQGSAAGTYPITPTLIDPNSKLSNYIVTTTPGTLTIMSTPAALPTFSPVGGTFTSAQTVTISDTTPGATIYYTTNGTVPTTNSAVYTGPITVSVSETIQAIAVASGYTHSSMAAVGYTIKH